MKNENYLTRLAKDRIDDIVERLRLDTSTNLQVDIEIDNSANINGKTACISDDHYVVCLNISNVNFIDGFLFTSLEGNLAENEYNRHLFYKNISWDFSFDLYIESRRVDYSSLLRELCNEYIIYHEIGHIFNGHLKLKGLTELDSKTLEMDADSFAICRMWEMLNYRYTELDGLILDMNHAIWLAIVACTIVFSLQGMGNIFCKNSSDKYLPKRLRLLIIQKNIIEISQKIETSMSVEIDMDMTTFIEGAKFIEDMVNVYLINTSGLSEEEININNNLEQFNHIGDYEKLIDHWRKIIRRKLENYAYVQLAD